MTPYLSVIVIAFQEGELIGRTLLEIDHYLRQKDYLYEIIIVVDGKSSKNTGEIAKNYAQRINNLKVIENDGNNGKGYGVRRGLLESKGKFRVFLDADGSTSIGHLDKFLPELENGSDVVIGSRYLKDSFIQVHQPKYREFLGIVSNFIIRLVLGLWDYPDTQCGFKAFSEKAAKEIGEKTVVNRFGFDFELIAVAKILNLKIKQLPVRWLNESNSAVKLIGPNSFLQALGDLMKTRWRIFRGHYNSEQIKKIQKNKNK